jgi:hypothetical protein
MQSTAEVILEAALKLPENERLAVVSRLLETLPADVPCLSLDDPSFEEELERRFNDREGSMSWSELRDER